MKPKPAVTSLFGVRIELITTLFFDKVIGKMVCPVCQNAKGLDGAAKQDCPGELTANGLVACSSGKLSSNAKNFHPRCHGTSRITCRYCHGTGRVSPYSIIIGKPLSGEYLGKILAYAVYKGVTVGPLPRPIRYPEPSDNCLANSSWSIGVPNYSVGKN